LFEKIEQELKEQENTLGHELFSGFMMTLNDLRPEFK